MDNQKGYDMLDNEAFPVVMDIQVVKHLPTKAEPEECSGSNDNSPKKRKNRCREKEIQGMNIGHWTKEEKRLYFLFLFEHQQHFFNKELRRMDKIFKSMSTFIGTRAADQCRSHHQKIEKKYHSFLNILTSLRQIHDAENEDSNVKQQYLVRLQGISMFEDPSDNQEELLVKKQFQIPQKSEFREERKNSEGWDMTQGLEQLHYL